MSQAEKASETEASYLFTCNTIARMAYTPPEDFDAPPEWYLQIQNRLVSRRFHQFFAFTLFLMQAVTLVVVNHGFSDKDLVTHKLTTNSSTSFSGVWTSAIDSSSAYVIAMNALTGVLVVLYFVEVIIFFVCLCWPDKKWWPNFFGFFYIPENHQVLRGAAEGGRATKNFEEGWQFLNLFRLAALIFSLSFSLTCAFSCGTSHKTLLASFSKEERWLSFSLYSSMRLMDLMTVIPYADAFWHGIFRSTKKIFVALIPLIVFLWFFAVMCQILFGMDPFMYPYEGAKVDFVHINSNTGSRTEMTKKVSEFPQVKGKTPFDHDFFSTGPNSFVTMFQLYTQDEWAAGIVRPTMALADDNSQDALLNSVTVFLFFFVYLFVASIIIANYFTGIVVSAVFEGHMAAQKDLDSDDELIDGETQREFEKREFKELEAEVAAVSNDVKQVKGALEEFKNDIGDMKETFSQNATEVKDLLKRLMAIKSETAPAS